MDQDTSLTETTTTATPERTHGANERLRLERNKLAKRLVREAGRAIGDYRMIEAGDRVMVWRQGFLRNARYSHALARAGARGF